MRTWHPHHLGDLSMHSMRSNRSIPSSAASTSGHPPAAPFHSRVSSLAAGALPPHSRRASFASDSVSLHMEHSQSTQRESVQAQSRVNVSDVRASGVSRGEIDGGGRERQEGAGHGERRPLAAWAAAGVAEGSWQHAVGEPLSLSWHNVHVSVKTRDGAISQCQQTSLSPYLLGAAAQNRTRASCPSWHKQDARVNASREWRR
jgi:hypothetical protein